MSRNSRCAVALALLAWAAAPARPALATEYVYASGVALPGGGRAERVQMAGVRRLVTGGLLGEVSATRLGSGAGLWAIAYARPVRGLRAGGGVLALRAPDRTSPASGAPVAGGGFQLACGAQVPLSDELGVDLDARYVCFERPQASAAPDRFASRYWTFTLGVTVLGGR